MGYTVLGSVSKKGFFRGKVIFKVITIDGHFFYLPIYFFIIPPPVLPNFSPTGETLKFYFYFLFLSLSLYNVFVLKPRRRRHRLCNILEGIIYQVIERRTGNVE